MAAECPLSERRIVEIKMGRSKFPGKPSKIGNRKRVNLSSCALPEENESSKAAENIYLGLSMFNEAFGDNEMVPPKSFPGFSPEDVEDALAEARLQQRESELEYKKQGISINMQDDFQNEFTSIVGCFNLNENSDKNKTKLCFDGGGSNAVEICNDAVVTSDSNLFNSNKMTSNPHDNNNGKVKDSLNRNKYFKKSNILCKRVRTVSKRRNIFWLSNKPDTLKSLQSMAAKKLLQKAKKSNISEINKSITNEKKFVLPTFSMRSLRVIKPNKKFLEDSDGKKEKLSHTRLKNKTSQSTSDKLHSAKKSVVCGDILINKELRVEIMDKISKKIESSVQKKVMPGKELNVNLKTNCSLDSTKSNLHCTSTGKLILREPRLQLNRINLGLAEGPFSSSSSHSSSLSPNSHLSTRPNNLSTLNKTLCCGVCGSIKFYKFVGLTKKFGVNCCELCQKFISKILKSVESERTDKLQCLTGKGLCIVPPVIKNQNSAISKMDCEACWLKVFLKNCKIPNTIKIKLSEMLPLDMHMNVNLDSPLPACKDGNSFGISDNNMKPFKWCKDKDTINDCVMPTRRRTIMEKMEVESLQSTTEVREILLRKENISTRTENRRKLLRHKGRIKSFTEVGNRQRMILKGPRVKNVCRSASIVLGQPIATFPHESSPKKQIGDLHNEIKNVEKPESTNESCIESQEVVTVDKSKENTVSDRKLSSIEKKSNIGTKQLANANEKPSPTHQNNVGRTKRKSTFKTENPVSIDFWETYDPEEVCETGFGLIGSENFSIRALCFLCGSSGQEKLIHCASCCEPYHEFCVNGEQVKVHEDAWKYDWICPRCTVCVTCGKTSGQQLKCVKCENSYHTECVDRVGGRLLHSPDRPWVCSNCLRCKSCNGIDVSVFVGNLPLCKTCFVLRQKGNYCPLCQRCYEDDDYDSKMMECGQCKCWVHAKCEGLSDEKYQVLSFLPESVEYICRMCCVMPPAPWWIAVEAELKSGYLGVLKALSKNRKACTMLKWSPRKQCTCRQVNFAPRALDFEDGRLTKPANELYQSKGENVKKSNEQECNVVGDSTVDSCKPGPVLERKTSIEVINHATEGSIKLTLKIMKNGENKERSENNENLELEGENSVKMKNIYEKFNIKECSVRVKKCPLNENMDSPMNLLESMEDSQDKNVDFSSSSVELPDKRPLSSPLNPSSDSGIGSTDDELKTNSLTDEESSKLDEQQSNRFLDLKLINEPPVSFLEDKNECICFLEVDSYNSRSKPFSPSLLSIKKKVTTSEYSSLQQFHMDMQRMIATTQSAELMEMYHQTVREIFPWFDPKFSRVNTSSQKISDTTSLESTPVKNSPTKSIVTEDCKIPKEKLVGQPLEYYYSGFSLDDDRLCLMCKETSDGAPNDTGRLLYCGQNEWVHCNCALWSAEVFEEIDGSLQNVHSAINRGRSIRCPVCNMKGASIGCCARNCAETFHFRCARKIGCSFMDDKTVYCPSHFNETKGKIVQNENEFEIRRPVYVELDKRKMKSVDSSQVRFACGGLHVENLGRFVAKLSDQPEAIIPDQFQCTRLFWSCFEPWKIVKYHFSIRLQEDEQDEGVDFGINLTVDHSVASEMLELKLKQLRYFQEHQKLLEIEEPLFENNVKEKRKLNDVKLEDDCKTKSDETKCIPAKRPKKDHKIVKKIVDMFDPREDESCLSDSQNTADLIPPELEEAIFKDLPNDILDGISMQDIFMDIKNDLYENSEKDCQNMEDAMEVEEMLPVEQTKVRKFDINGDNNTHSENLVGSDDSKQNIYEWTDELCPKSNRELKRSRSDVLPGRRSMSLRNSQRSCSLNWNCKMDIQTTRWKRNAKCHTTANTIDSQERGSMLQELKFTDGLVMVSTDSVRDLKDRLAIQHEEGKENKCLSWHMKLQPRLLQVDGGVDSSSSGSEAGESPQRLIEESVIGGREIPPSQSSSFPGNVPYSANNVQSTSSSQIDYPFFSTSFNLPQIDGMGDSSSDESDFENYKTVRLRQTKFNWKSMNYKIPQVDGSADSENEHQFNRDENVVISHDSSPVKDEPVKCNQCRCTYRTKKSYERHLENCSNDYILFSSDGEGSEEENSVTQTKSECNSNVPTENRTVDTKPPPLEDKNDVKPTEVIRQNTSAKPSVQKEQAPVKCAVRREKIKRPQVRKKNSPTLKKIPVATNSPNIQQIIVPQSAIPPAVIVQDIAQPNIVPGAYLDTGGAIQYITSLETQGSFSKPQLIAAPGTVIPSNFHIQASESQLIPNLSVLPQNVQTNLPGIFIQQPQVTGTLISPQPAPMVMSGEQVVLGAPPLLEVIHDPQTGGMYLASHNQPFYYNMETIVSNTVMQTNQYVSNVMTASSFSQTSTQVVQTSKLEQIMNVPSNFILVGQNPSDKIITPGDIICLPTTQSLISSQTPVQAVVGPIIQTSQPYNTEPKIIPAPINQSVRCISAVQSKTSCTTPVLTGVTGNQTINRTPEARSRITTMSYQKNLMQNKQSTGNFRSMPMMRPNVTKSPPRQYEKAVIIPKSTGKSGSRAIVDFINNFKSDNCDVSPPVNKHEITNANEMSISKANALSPERKETDLISKDLQPFTIDISVPLPSIEPENRGLSNEVKENPPPETAPVRDVPIIELDSDESMEIDLKAEEENTKKKEEIKINPVCNLESVFASVEEEKSKDEITLQESHIQEEKGNEILTMTTDDNSKTNDVESPKNETPTVPTLPLQETSPSANNTPNLITKTPNTKSEMPKGKSKLLGSNQNCLATKLVTIHPRLIQNPEFEAESENKNKYCANGKSDEKGPKLIFDVISDDGFKSSSTSMAELWAKICDSVQEMRAVFKIPPLPISRKGHEILGMQNHGLQHCLEQLRGVEQCVKYKCKYFVKERSQKPDDRLTPVKENLSGCARTETYCDRKEYDMFAWLASRHRRLPKLCETSEELLSSARRANSLPMAMRYRHLRESAKTYVGVYRSKIHGKGLFCLRQVEAGEMVIEYAGEVIRSNITDKREKYYTEKGIGCYMFRIDDHFVVDATMKGNAARFINHSCEPNCYSRVVDILGKKHIVIFALRRIRVMEELTYDYKFPFEDEKISCHCLSKKCRKYLN